MTESELYDADLKENSAKFLSKLLLDYCILSYSGCFK